MTTATPADTDYATLYEAFKQEIPEYYNFGFDVMDRWAEDRTKLALVSVRRDAEKDRLPHVLRPEPAVEPLRQRAAASSA